VEEEHPREEEVHPRQEEEVPEDLMHPVFFRTAHDVLSSGGMYESEDESEDDEGEEGDDGEEEDDGEEGDDGEVDSRRWEPLKEGEEFFEPHEVLRLIEPGSLPVYCRRVSLLPDLEN
jgi:hypothetical protein